MVNEDPKWHVGSQLLVQVAGTSNTYLQVMQPVLDLLRADSVLLLLALADGSRATGESEWEAIGGFDGPSSKPKWGFGGTGAPKGRKLFLTSNFAHKGPGSKVPWGLGSWRLRGLLEA